MEILSVNALNTHYPAQKVIIFRPDSELLGKAECGLVRAHTGARIGRSKSQYRKDYTTLTGISIHTDINQYSYKKHAEHQRCAGFRVLAVKKRMVGSELSGIIRVPSVRPRAFQAYLWHRRTTSWFSGGRRVRFRYRHNRRAYCA